MKQVSIGWRTSALLAGLAAVPVMAWAQSATQTLPVQAQVERFCKFNAVALQSGANNFTPSSLGLASSIMTVTTPIDADGHLVAANFTLNFASTCNFASRVTLTTAKGAMKPDSAILLNPATASAFATRIDYTASAVWGPTGANLNTAFGGGAAPGTQSIGSYYGSPISDTLAVTITINNNPSTVVAAGHYSDVLTIALEPQ